MKIEAYMNMMADLRAENEELKERLNYIESKLKSIKQQLAPKKYQFSANEKTILRSLSEEWKWLARDKSGILYLYTNRPIKVSDHYMFSQGRYAIFDTFGHLFQSIQWTDDEPVEIEKVIRE